MKIKEIQSKSEIPNVISQEKVQQIKSEKVAVKDIRNFIKEYFPEVYKSERKKEINEKLKSTFRGLFAKKEDRNK